MVLSSLERFFPSISIINLPNTFENYLLQLSKKNRHEIRRKIRKFENNLEFEIVETDESNVDEHLLEFLRLMKLNPEKRNFYDLEKMWSEDIPKEKALI